MILYVNSCVRKESRTDRIARALLKKLGEYEEVRLDALKLEPLDGEKLNKRTELINEGKLDDPMFALARQFAAADVIVVSAPYWDLSFPAILKTYVENIFITGIVSKYDETGMPVGLCSAKKLYYVATAGGPYFPESGYGYFQALAKLMFGIEETELIYAENLDIWGNDPEKIIADTLKKYGLC